MDSKICNVCLKQKYITKFYKCNACTFGVTGTCKECSLLKSKLHYRKKGYLVKQKYGKENKERIKEKRKIYSKSKKAKEAAKKSRIKNSTKIKQYQKVWANKNKDYILDYQKKYRQKNKETLKQKYKNFYKKNKNKIREKCKKYVHNNKEKCNAWRRKYDKKRRENIQIKISDNISRRIHDALKSKKEGKKWELLVGYNISQLIAHLESKFKKGMNWKNYGLYGWHIDHIIPRSNFKITDYHCDDFKKCWSLNNLQPLWAKENLHKSNKVQTH